jgi:GAF domain-containing protein
MDDDIAKDPAVFDLAASLGDLSGLLSPPGALETTLVRIAELAVRAIPGAEGAGLALLESDRPQTVVATDDFVRTVDDVQYSLGEGPCLSAVADRQAVWSANLRTEPRWKLFGSRAGQLGVHSALSLPLLLTDRVLGALNVYAHPADVFDEHALRIGGAFGGPAAVSVFNAQVLAQAERLVGRLETALTSRTDIDQAVGLLIGRTGATAEDALGRLQTLSRSEGVTVGDIARNLLGEAGRDRTRLTDAGAGPVERQRASWPD